MLTIGSLFAGYGGLDIGIQQAIPARTAWVSEIDPGACKVLAHRYPDVPNLGDITRIDWSQVEPVDIIAGGSPCQDLSTAGRRAGMTEGTRSNLWVQMREAIAHVQPTFVVWENVRGAFSAHADSDLESCEGCMGDPEHAGPSLRALGRVQGDLADLGYDAQWRGLRAADVGACHGRFRVFLLAWRRAAFADADHSGLQGLADSPRAAQAGRHGHAEPGAGRSDLTLLPTPSSSLASCGGSQHPDKLRGGGHQVKLHDVIEHLLPTPRATDGSKGGPNQLGSKGDLMLPSAVQQLLPTPVVTDAKGARNATSGRKEGSQHHSGTTLTDAMSLLPTPRSSDTNGAGAHGTGGMDLRTAMQRVVGHDHWGGYAAAIARHEQALGCPAPAPTEPGHKGRPRLSARFVEWMMMLPEGWVTDVPGITRTQALRMLGNGVVPAQATAALRHMLATLEAEARAAG